jgi:hypothetical protein
MSGTILPPGIPRLDTKALLARLGDNYLSDLAARINAEHEAAVVAIKRGIEHSIAAGELLLEAKAKVGHGNWLPWLKANCPTVSERTAQLYMRLARHREELSKSATVADLTMKAALELLHDGASDDDIEPDDDDDTRRIQQLGGSGDDEYLTPAKYAEAVRDVLGTIDLDLERVRIIC